MLLDLLRGVPHAASAHGIATPSLTNLQDGLSFSEILTSSFPGPSSSVPLLQILQEDAAVSVNDAVNEHSHQSCSNSQNLPLGHTNFLNNLFRRNDQTFELACAPPLHQRSCHDVQLAESYAHVTCEQSCHRGTETLAWPHSSFWHRGADASKSSTSTVTSEPSSTLETMEAGELVAVVQESHWESSNIRTRDMQRLKETTQNSCQTSLDEGTSMQESLPYVTIGDDAYGTMYTADEGCSFDNCSAPNMPKQAGADDCAIASRPPARKRKRSRSCKNSDEVESQRMMHIAVERNRRRQMNEHLSALRSLMPSTYIQRGDQASIVGGAIDFVKELEHVLQVLQAQRNHRDSKVMGYTSKPDSSSIFEDPSKKQQFSHHGQDVSRHSNDDHSTHVTCEGIEVDVRLSGTFALVKVLAQKLPHQLLKATRSIESFNMKIMHLNITTIDTSVLYSFNLEVQGHSQFRSADGIAHLVQKLFSAENQCFSTLT